MFAWFERLVDPFKNDDLSAPPAGLIGFCLYFARPLWPILALVALLAGTVAVAEVAVYRFFGNLVDWLQAADRDTFLADNGTSLAAMAILVLVVIPIMRFGFNLLYQQGVMSNFPMAIRWRVHRYLLRQSYSFYQDDFAGRIATKLMQTALAVREIVTRLSDTMVYVTVQFLSAVVVVGSADWRLMLPFLIWIAAYIGAMRVFIPRLGTIAGRQADARSVMTGHIVDTYTNISTVKLFAHARREETHARGTMERFLASAYDQFRLVTQLNTTLSIINTLLLTVVAALSIWLWMGESVATGDIAVAVALALRLQGMSEWIMWEMGGLFEALGTVKDGISTISRPRLVNDVPDAGSLTVREGAIRFENIHFRYGEAAAVIDGLDLAIAPGEKIGLIGRSGAGKSTLVSLLMRFYDLDSGRITIDGQDVSQVTQESLRACISVVTQDTSLLHRSVRENIAYSRPDATEDEIIAAAEQAHAMEFIHDLVDSQGRRGLDAHVGERGVKLSGGQRQRIAIARVLLKDAPILVLDEATSALDSEIEAAIQDQLQMLMQGKTVIAIAHRLSTIAEMDRLVVMRDGAIVEQGRHAELLAEGGVYAQLWARQSGGFLSLGEGQGQQPAGGRAAE